MPSQLTTNIVVHLPTVNGALDGDALSTLEKLTLDELCTIEPDFAASGDFIWNLIFFRSSEPTSSCCDDLL